MYDKWTHKIALREINPISDLSWILILVICVHAQKPKALITKPDISPYPYSGFTPDEAQVGVL